MKVGILMHFRVPRRAGSEVMMHSIAQKFIQQGHEVFQITTDSPELPEYEVFEGIPSYSVGHDRQKIYRIFGSLRPDIIFTHHQRAEIGIPAAHLLKIPSVLIAHNDMTHTLRELRLRPTLTVFNTQWLSDKLGHMVRQSMVVHPPVFPQGCNRPSPGEGRVTLINLNRDKGGEIFYQLAKRLPGIEFLGVEGGHGNQIILRNLPNVEIQSHTSNMCEDVWQRTGILLVPSIYESYGMVGLEAASQGIPVIANPTLGLKESLGSAGWFIPRDNINLYAATIRKLYYNSELYDEWAIKGLERFNDVNPDGEMAALVETVEGLVWKSV